MSDIFISYARSTADQAQAVAEGLRGLGYNVWRDDELPAHRAYAEVIEERLSSAKAVVVIWSAEAVKSEWVQSEADQARAARKLVQLTLDGAKLPMPFDRIQCADMTGWAGDLEAHSWKKVVASVAELIGGGAAQPKSGPAVRKLSICVLPFANMSDDPQQEYFSDGISEDIITDLSKVSALSVVARNTAFTFKGKSVEVPDIARRLGVSHVLEGSVRKAGGRVRITAQLIEGAAGDHVWAERYDRDLTDIFALQDEISEAIVKALKLKLLPEERQAIEKRGTTNAEAYNLYLMARRYWVGREAKRRSLVIRLCQGAVDLDPGFARGWALMAICQGQNANVSNQAGDTGWTAAERALALDPDLAEAHAAKATILTYEGRFDEAQAEVDIALRLDPSSPDVNSSAASVATAARRFADAVRYCEVASAMDVADCGAPFMAIQCHDALGDLAGARAAATETVARIEKALAAEPDNGNLLGFGVVALTFLGERDRAKAWAEQALLVEPDNGIMQYNLACAMVRAGDTDFALDLLRKALAQGSRGNLVWAESDSDLDALRGHPRYQTIIAEADARCAAQVR